MVKIVKATGWRVGWVSLVEIVKIVKAVNVASWKVGWVTLLKIVQNCENCERGENCERCWLQSGLCTPGGDCEECDYSEGGLFEIGLRTLVGNGKIVKIVKMVYAPGQRVNQNGENCENIVRFWLDGRLDSLVGILQSVKMAYSTVEIRAGYLQ